MAEPHKKVLTAIKACHTTEAELYTLMEEVCEGNPSSDQVANTISGIIELSRLRVEKLKREYEFTIIHSHME
jgi:hypothetical protein